ncbi:MAG: nucleotidyltransferase domain-containing protein [Oscillospiraceae bacterium]|nr:nucleotidyltransferase domain-containing protein [Oscillospiraceae bacterium]
MTAQARNELNSIVKAIADTGMASKIILFGSMARGEETPESDIDLCVLTPITDRRPLDISIDLRRKLFHVKNMPLDLLTYNQDKFEEHAASPASFAHLINTEGVVVYER